MPIYEYRCGDCEETFEEIQRFSDPDPESCPACDGKDVSRLVSRSNFQLKGSGWYADDYGSAPSESSTSAPATTSDDKAGSTESSSTTEASSTTESSSTTDSDSGSSDQTAAAE